MLYVDIPYDLIQFLALIQMLGIAPDFFLHLPDFVSVFTIFLPITFYTCVVFINTKLYWNFCHSIVTRLPFLFCFTTQTKK